METETTSFSANFPPKVSNYDELFMQQSLLFVDSLKDLKDLRKQLYSAAEYFELSYQNDDQRDLMVETLKEYAARALISTVDHLGSVAFKVNCFLDEKIDRVSKTSQQIFCIEQRLRTCKDYIDKAGLSQQSWIQETPRYHKRYTFPVGGSQHDSSKLMYNSCISCTQTQSDSNQRMIGSRGAIMRQSRSPFRKRPSGMSSTQISTNNIGTFSFTRTSSSREPAGKRSISPLRMSLKRSGSIANASIPRNPCNIKQRFPYEPRRTVSMWIKPEREANNGKEIEQYTKKSRQFLKAMFSVHKSRKEDQPKKHGLTGLMGPIL